MQTQPGTDLLLQEADLIFPVASLQTAIVRLILMEVSFISSG
jgi:hypothetical protein